MIWHLYKPVYTILLDGCIPQIDYRQFFLGSRSFSLLRMSPQRSNKGYI